MINNCDEEFRLAEVYQLATTRFSEAAKKPGQRMGSSSKAQYARLDRAANEERAQNQSAQDWNLRNTSPCIAVDVIHSPHRQSTNEKADQT